MSFSIPENSILSLTFLGNTGAISLSNALNQGTFLGLKCIDNRCASDLTAEEARDVRFLYGHGKPSVLTVYGRPIFYATMVRDPVKKFISDYNWYRGYYCGSFSRDSSAYADWQENRKKPFWCVRGSWEDFLDSLESLGLFADYCLQYPSVTGLWSIMCSLYPEKFSLSDKDNPGTADRLVAHMQQTWSLIGITELFEETLFLISRSLNLPSPAPWVRVGPFQPTISDDRSVCSETLEKIRKSRTFEYLVYNKLRESFERQLKEFSFDEEFMDYKVRSLLFDNNIMGAYLSNKKEYMPKAMIESPDAMHRFSVALLKAFVRGQPSTIG